MLLCFTFLSPLNIFVRSEAKWTNKELLSTTLTLLLILIVTRQLQRAQSIIRTVMHWELVLGVLVSQAMLKLAWTHQLMEGAVFFLVAVDHQNGRLNCNLDEACGYKSKIKNIIYKLRPFSVIKIIRDPQ
jgi:hypothetical protein